jgi:type I restriction enzyme M protein
LDKTSAAYQRLELHRTLWNMAVTMRGTMEGSEYRNYVLGLLFYRTLSEKTESIIAGLLAEDNNMDYVTAWNNPEYREAIEDTLLNDLGYVIPPIYLWSTMVAEIRKGANGEFDTEYLQKGINAIMTSTIGKESQEDFENLFDDLDLNSPRLGRDVKTRTRIIADNILAIDGIDFNLGDSKIDVLGDAYEYLIGNFAASAGKKAGEFYTPQQVSTILSRIVAAGKTRLSNVYDPTCGSGSLLLRVAREVEVGEFYGQELMSTTFNLARMNMMIHDISYNRFHIKNGNTLTEPMHIDRKFEAIVANPPYSTSWETTELTLQDERFSGYGKLAPSTKADFAFVQHMIYHLDDEGTAAVVLPHGVLFRGAAEGVIRKKIIEDNRLHAVIGLPANIFFGTGIPTCILVFKKNRTVAEPVLFIDASQEFEKGKNSNSLTDENVTKITDAYISRQEVGKYSALVTKEQIAENDYNLNIPRYIDNAEEEEIIDLDGIAEKISKLDTELDIIDSKIKYNQLVLHNAVKLSSVENKNEVVSIFSAVDTQEKVRGIQGKALFLYNTPYSYPYEWGIATRGLKNSQPFAQDDSYVHEKGFYLIADNLENLRDTNLLSILNNELKKKDLFLESSQADLSKVDIGLLSFNLNALKRVEL